MELKRYLGLLRHWAWLLGLFPLAGMAIALGVSLYMTPVYQSSVKLLLDSSRSTSAAADYNSVLASQSLAQTYSQMLVARPVLENVITTLGLPLTTEQLLKRVTVTVVRNTQLIALTVEDTNSDQAARVANEIVAEFGRQNQDLQTSRYTASEKAIQTQLANIESDMVQNQA